MITDAPCEQYLFDLPARPGESGAAYYARLAAVQFTGGWFKCALRAGRPQRELNAILSTYFDLTCDPEPDAPAPDAPAPDPVIAELGDALLATPPSTRTRPTGP